MTVTANLGFPRIGVDRELKWALESAWRSGDFDDLRAVSADLRKRHWQLQADRGIERIPVGDFSLYDHMLDTALMVGAVPERFGGKPFNPEGSDPDLSRYFVMARGGDLDGADRAPLEMTKWFDTNYHQLVPELGPEQVFEAHPERLLAHLSEAREIGIDGRVVMVGPVTFLARSKRTDGGNTFELIDRLTPAYVGIVRALREAGATAFQFDEPILVTDVSREVIAALHGVYQSLAAAADGAETMVATYFGPLGASLAAAVALPVDVLHVDLVRGGEQLEAVLDAVVSSEADPAVARANPLSLSLGIVDGRNLWRSDLDACIEMARRAIDRLGADRIQIAPSCSLLHLPVDLSKETALDPELRSWLAFATERLDEVRLIARALGNDTASHAAPAAAVDAAAAPSTVAPAAAHNAASAATHNTAHGAVPVAAPQPEIASELAENRAAIAARRSSTRVHRPEVAERVAAITPEMAARQSPYAQRQALQNKVLNLPPLPTTTIGSFPQTREIRELRSRFRRGEIDTATYEEGLREATAECVHEQERLGLDVLVHGEFERTDMVEYFGDRLDGFFTTANGWVQSYGSRCVKPPVLYGDIVRNAPMTVDWASYAAGLTDRPMKGMLTGPVTILCWSFVRDDQPWSDTARQLALVLRDEVTDLVDAGIPIIQIDEPALREGLPLREAERDGYLAWTTEAFRLSAGSAPDDIQIHTHMCYGDFGDIIDAIVDLDVDVISMEASRSQMDLLGDFVDREYPNEIGPGIWDIHSPRVPGDAELDDLLARAIRTFGPDRLWVNPDCGLKTRGWDETRESLAGMVATARRARELL